MQWFSRLSIYEESFYKECCIARLSSMHNPLKHFIQCKKVFEGIFLRDYIEERAIDIANYIIDYNATVRQTAKEFGISKSTVHTVVTKQNVLCG